MRIETFAMERMQCLYENTVEFNLSESGVSPFKLGELLDVPADRRRIFSTKLGYPESDGSLAFRERIAQFYPGCAAENVTVVNGGSEANYVTLWTLLKKGERLACMLPNYMQAWGLGGAFAGGVDAFHLVLCKENGERRWALDLDELKKAVTKKTGVILVTNPNNPTGAVLNEEEMNAVVKAAQRVGAWLIVDEIYRGAEIEGDTSPTFWGRYEKLIITSGLSKAFGMPGLRVGWVVAPPKLIERLWVRHDYLTLTPNTLGDRLGAIAMEPARREQILARTRSIIRQNLPPLEEWLAAQGDLLIYARPRAGAIVYFKYKLPIKSSELAERLRLEHSVLVVPGEQFGIGRGLRVGFGYDMERTLKGLERVQALMSQLV